MTHMVEHSPWHAETGWPWLIVIHPNGTQSIRCTSEKTAARVAQALDLLDAKDAIKPGDAMKIDDKGGFLHRHLDGRYHWLSEKEIMQRAREAAIAAVDSFPDADDLGPLSTANRVYGIRLGTHDTHCAVLAAACALRDLSKPLADLVPPTSSPASSSPAGEVARFSTSPRARRTTMLQRDLDALLAALGPRPKRPAGVHDWAPPFSAPYCRKCGTTTAERRAMQECVR